jgi:hypothetical protein
MGARLILAGDDLIDPFEDEVAAKGSGANRSRPPWQEEYSPPNDFNSFSHFLARVEPPSGCERPRKVLRGPACAFPQHSLMPSWE